MSFEWRLAVRYTEKSISIRYLGSPGSFSQYAAEQAKADVAEYVHRHQGGPILLESISTESRLTSQELDTPSEDTLIFCVFPIRNSELGEVLDFTPFRSYPMIAEVQIDVEFILCNATGRPEHIKSIATKHTAFQMVRDALVRRGFELTTLAKPDGCPTAVAAQRATQDPTIAAVCSSVTCEMLGLKQIGDALHRSATIFGVIPVCEPGQQEEQASRKLVFLPSVSDAFLCRLAEEPSELAHCPDRLFEELVAELLTQDGWAVELITRLNAPGPDIVAMSHRFVQGHTVRMLVECKRYSSDKRVDVRAVRNLVYWVNEEQSANLGMLATTSTFTRGARKAVQERHRWRISLKDQGDILAWLRSSRLLKN